MIKYKLINTFSRNKKNFSMIEIQGKDYSKCNYHYDTIDTMLLKNAELYQKV